MKEEKDMTVKQISVFVENTAESWLNLFGCCVSIILIYGHCHSQIREILEYSD